MMKKVNNCDIIRTRLYKWRIILSKISYKKLFKKMIDLDMKNTELMEKAEIRLYISPLHLSPFVHS